MNHNSIQESPPGTEMTKTVRVKVTLTLTLEVTLTLIDTRGASVLAWRQSCIWSSLEAKIHKFTELKHVQDVI